VVEKYVWKRTDIYILASIIIDLKIGLWLYCTKNYLKKVDHDTSLKLITT